MRPDVIVTDELFDRDMESVDSAVHCGTAVISTVHAKNLVDFYEKPEYAALVGRKIFSHSTARRTGECPFLTRRRGG